MTYLTDGSSAGGSAGYPVADLQLFERERWFAAQTISHREKTALFHLNAQGFRAFFPSFQKKVRHARTVRDVIQPLFPGYIFVIIDPDRSHWRSINGTIGISRLVTTGDRPLPAPAGVIEALIASMDGAGRVQLDHGLRVGQRVRVLAGPFAEQFGILERLDARGRVRVLLSILGGPAPVQIDSAHIISA